jgi:hypothetical protein
MGGLTFPGYGGRSATGVLRRLATSVHSPVVMLDLVVPTSKAEAWLIRSAARSGLHPLAPWQLQVPQFQLAMGVLSTRTSNRLVGGAAWCVRESRNERVRRHCRCALPSPRSHQGDC